MYAVTVTTKASHTRDVDGQCGIEPASEPALVIGQLFVTTRQDRDTRACGDGLAQHGVGQ